MNLMPYAAIKYLIDAIEGARSSTRNEAELSKLDFAERMVVHGREFVDVGDYRAAWLRLSGAVSYLERAGVAGVSGVHAQLHGML